MWCDPAMRRALSIVCLLLVTSACDQGAREELAAVREEVARQQATVSALQKRIEEVSAELQEEREERRAADAERMLAAPPLPTSPALPDSAAVLPVCEGNRCTLTRAEVDLVLSDQPGLVRGARVVPAVKDGATIGFKLFGIRPGTLYAALGLQNGDTVQALGGKPVTTMQALLDAYAAARTADRVTITGVRKDAPFEIVVEVRADEAAPKPAPKKPK